MDDDRTEACGRCGFTSVVDAVGDGDRDLYGDDRIEISESDARATGRHVEWAGRAKRRLDSFAHRVAYGKRS